MSRYSTRARRREEEPEEEEGRPRYARRQSSGMAPAVFGMLVIVVIAVAAIFIISNIEEQETVASTVDETDPFAGLPPDTPPERRKPKLSSRNDDDADGNIFAGLADVRDDPVWIDSKRIAEEGRQLGLAAGEAQAAGNVALFREKAKAAKDKYNEALEKSYQFEQDIARDNGWDHPDVRRVANRRSAWTRKLAEFKKMGGL